MNCGLEISRSERRIHRIALAIAAVSIVGYWSLFRFWLAPISVLLGVVLAAINFHWLRAGVEGVILPSNRKKIKWLVFKFLARLVLIFGVLYAMIRVSLVGAGGVLVGLSMYVLAIMAEAVFSLLSSTKNRCRNMNSL
ncbi:MAG: hypothetical protein HY644_01210 [Acidobacteria bacterium]|nr:hypothetical protein [Acidobacteriota bacterium]